MMGISLIINSINYVNPLQNTLFSKAGANNGDDWTFQQDNDIVNTSHIIMKFFESYNIDALD